MDCSIKGCDDLATRLINQDYPFCNDCFNVLFVGTEDLAGHITWVCERITEDDE